MNEKTKIKLLKYAIKTLNDFVDSLVIGVGWGFGFVLVLILLSKYGGGQ